KKTNVLLQSCQFLLTKKINS
ncbi:DNA gyrase subunit A, partial [Haemophilus influenzae]